MTRLVMLVASVFVLLMVAPVARAVDPPYKGKPVHEVLEGLRENGLNLVYSTNLVSPQLVVTTEPSQGAPALLAREILEPHGLTLDRAGVNLVVVRATSNPTAAPQGPDSSPEESAGDVVKLEDLSISASRYILFSNSQFFIDQRAIQALPDLGEDPIRSVHRLPGAAAGGLSSRSHFRGGEHNETAIYLNGLKLLDPFHIRDYHSIFSSIDARAISGVEAFTGGFPATYGDQLSGVLLLESAQPEEPVHTELGLSIYNTSLLNSGYTSGGRFDWLVSARSSNLDIVLDEDLGKPDYFDVFTQLGIDLGSDHHLSVNALYSNDQVLVITESDPEELEQSVSDTKNTHFWVSLDSEWSPFLNSKTVLSYSGLENQRNAEANDPERMLAVVSDRREAKIVGFQQDWIYAGLSAHTLRAGIGIRREEADYDYQAFAEYLGFFEYYPGLENPVEHDVTASPSGNSYSLYLSDRWQLSERSGLELGLRWDRQTYTGVNYGNQLSPRISFLHSMGSATELRLTWGRYYQSQAIQELQVEDGLDRFFAPQRSDHWIAGIQHRFEKRYRLRMEAFYKNYDRLKPRFENLFDPLALIPELAPDRVRLDPESARSYGIETTLENRGGEELDWWVSYTWSKASDRINGADEYRSWDQRHALQAGLAWQRGPWEVGVAISIHSGWPTTAMDYEIYPADVEDEDEEDDIILPIPGPRNAEQLGTFAQLDFRISREFTVKHGRLSAFFEVSNATNRKNPCCIDYDVDEDEDGNIYLDREVEHWLPIIPAIGIFWEF